MKTMISLLFISLFFSNCGENNAATGKNVDASNSTANTTKDQAAVSGNGIVGSWKLETEAYDENENNILEDAERKKGFRNNYRFQFNSDGTCKIQGFYNGTYTVKEEKGNKVLTVQRERIKQEESTDPLPDVYHIKAESATEMTLQVIDDAYGLSKSTFWIFKREK